MERLHEIEQVDQDSQEVHSSDSPGRFLSDMIAQFPPKQPRRFGSEIIYTTTNAQGESIQISVGTRSPKIELELGKLGKFGTDVRYTQFSGENSILPNGLVVSKKVDNKGGLSNVLRSVGIKINPTIGKIASTPEEIQNLLDSQGITHQGAVAGAILYGFAVNRRTVPVDFLKRAIAMEMPGVQEIMVRDKAYTVLKSGDRSVYVNEKGIVKDFIKESERLVPVDGYKIDIKTEITKGAATFYPDYPFPKERIHMTPGQIAQWKVNGGKTADLSVGNANVTHHPNYESGLAKGKARVDDGTQDFRNTEFAESFDPRGYKRDERGLPIRPDDEAFLTEGAVEGNGFYWDYGPQKAGDPVVFRKRDGKLQVLVIERFDMSEAKRLGEEGKILSQALPGGMLDKNEPDVSAAIRELFEEAGIDLTGVPHKVVHQGIVWADPRATRHAWPESTVALLLPDSEDPRLDDIKLKAGDDARKASWIDVTEENVNNLFASHPGFVMLAVEAWQKETGDVVAKDGSVGLAA